MIASPQTIVIGSADVQGFRVWALDRGYSLPSVDTWTRMARRLVAATAGAPLPQSPEAAATLITQHRAPIRGTRNACQTGMRRLYEYLGRDA